MKTRFVCVSDTHGYTPSEAGFPLPAGDVLIHAGDLTNRGSEAEVRRTLEWIARAEYEVKIVVAGIHSSGVVRVCMLNSEGNHDMTLDPHFQDGRPEERQRCIKLIQEYSTTPSTSIVFLQHEAATIRLTRADGPQTTFKVFGSPYSPANSNDAHRSLSRHGQRTWAFQYAPADADRLWDAIPLDTDVVVTHTPPYSHCDRRDLTEGVSVGCPGLRQALQRVRPAMAVSGHVHESRGYEGVFWNSRGNGHGVVRGELPTGRKQSIVTVSRTKEESCIVNCSILGSSWPHAGGKRFNKAIVAVLYTS